MSWTTVLGMPAEVQGLLASFLEVQAGGASSALPADPSDPPPPASKRNLRTLLDYIKERGCWHSEVSEGIRVKDPRLINDSNATEDGPLPYGSIHYETTGRTRKKTWLRSELYISPYRSNDPLLIKDSDATEDGLLEAIVFLKRGSDRRNLQEGSLVFYNSY